MLDFLEEHAGLIATLALIVAMELVHLYIERRQALGSPSNEPHDKQARCAHGILKFHSIKCGECLKDAEEEFARSIDLYKPNTIADDTMRLLINPPKLADPNGRFLPGEVTFVAPPPSQPHEHEYTMVFCYCGELLLDRTKFVKPPGTSLVRTNDTFMGHAIILEIGVNYDPTNVLARWVDFMKEHPCNARGVSVPPVNVHGVSVCRCYAPQPHLVWSDKSKCNERRCKNCGAFIW